MTDRVEQVYRSEDIGEAVIKRQIERESAAH